MQMHVRGIFASQFHGERIRQSVSHAHGFVGAVYRPVGITEKPICLGRGIAGAGSRIVAAVNEPVRPVSLGIVKAAPFGYMRMSLHQIPAKKLGRPSAVMRLKMEAVILPPASQ